MGRFSNNFSEFLVSIQASQAYADVTLVSEDNTEIQSNQAILSWASPFFKSILKDIHNAQPMIYLTGVTKEELQNIVSFIYNGEVRIAKKNLPSFVSVSEDLQIQGLLESFVGDDEETMKSQDSRPKPANKENYQNIGKLNIIYQTTGKRETKKAGAQKTMPLNFLTVEIVDEDSNLSSLTQEELRHRTKNRTKEKNTKQKMLTKSPKTLDTYMRKEIIPENEEDNKTDVDMNYSRVLGIWGCVWFHNEIQD